MNQLFTRIAIMAWLKGIGSRSLLDYRVPYSNKVSAPRLGQRFVSNELKEKEIRVT